jgi:hypothetical protein
MLYRNEHKRTSPWKWGNIYNELTNQLINWLRWTEFFLRIEQAPKWTGNSFHIFYRPKMSLLCSQNPATGFCPKAGEYSPYPQTIFLQDPL